jgi:mycothiol system anti-sigma-R factor
MSESTKGISQCGENNCLKMLQRILDDEATAEEKNHFLTHHLEECMPCYQNYQLEVTIRQLLKNKCCQDAPQELVDSIKEKIKQNLSR